MKIICIPGLGGHRNVYQGYDTELLPYEGVFTQLNDWHKNYQEVADAVEHSTSVVIVGNCYGAQNALRAISKYPDKVKGLIIVEPFFSEFFWWRLPALFGTKIILGLIAIKDALGIHRKKLSFVDYRVVEKRPLWMQPLFDMTHQTLKDYYTKIEDILEFKLPAQVTVPTLFIFSPQSFMPKPEQHAQLAKIFVHADMMERGEKTHNIVTLSRPIIADEIKRWIKEKVL